MNIVMLKQKMRDERYSIRALATSAGISRSRLARRFQRKGETFTLEEANKIGKVLNLTQQELCSIFFQDNSQK